MENSEPAEFFPLATRSDACSPRVAWWYSELRG